MDKLPDWLQTKPSLPPEKLAVLEELRRRELAMTSLAEFSRMFVEVEPAKHHKIICGAVDAMVNDEFDVLVVMSPPASAKSTYISVAAPAYIMGRQPKARIISVSRAAELAAEFGGKVKNIVESALFGKVNNVFISQDSRAKDNWKTTDGGGYFAVGATGGVLGKRADWVICDDIHSSFEDAQSQSQLAKIHSWFESDLLSRLTPTGKLIVIGQRLSPNDIIGFVLRRAVMNSRIRMKVLKFTAICDNAENDPLHRQVGEKMWPEFYTDDYLHDKQQDAYIWKTLWMQEPPSDTGSWVATEDFRFAPTPAYNPKNDYYICTDLALSVGSGDYTVLIVVCHEKVTNRVHVVDMYRRRVDPEESSQQLVALCQTYKPMEVWIDDDNAAKVWMQLVATRARSTNTIVNWKPLPMRGQNKETRAAALRGMFKRGMMYFDPAKEWTNIIVNECLQFPNALGSGVDDCVDSLSLAGRRLTVLQTQSIVPPPPPRLTIANMSLDKLFEDRPRRGNRI